MLTHGNTVVDDLCRDEGVHGGARPRPGGPVRDFVGYGRRTPDVHWPGGASLVVNIVVNYESGGEYSLPDGDGRNDSWGEYSTQVGPEIRDLGTETHYEFGSRAGIWRLARLFDRYQVPVTIGASGRALERNPAVAEWLTEAGHDVLAHGWRWAEVSEMSQEEERKDLYQAIATIERLYRAAPAGLVRAVVPQRAHAAAAGRGGRVPLRLRRLQRRAAVLRRRGDRGRGTTPFLVVPYSKVYNDNRYLIAPTYSTPRDFFENLRAAADFLCDEAAAGHGARMMTVGLHERWSGQAGRATAIRDFIEYVQSRPDVRFMRRLDIATWWLDHHAEWGSAIPESSADPERGGHP